MMRSTVFAGISGLLIALAGCAGTDVEPWSSEGLKNTSNTIVYSGQGLNADGFGGYDLNLELCGTANGADVDGPYILWVLTATQATGATITGPWGIANMTASGGGTYKYISAWYAPATLPGNVTATYAGKTTNAQLTVSHGCRPYTHGAWCSPGFWRNATDAAWALAGVSKDASFDSNVYSGFFGATFDPDPTLITVLSTSGGTYKGPGVQGTAISCSLNAFNATGAFLTNHIPGYQFDCSFVQDDDSCTCPIDHFGVFKK
jgi:hypothetical protein